jgi:tRNA threonylcarbamoyl adenosine modification protein (Sua5/YciO/YrdC/YwlC family)
MTSSAVFRARRQALASAAIPRYAYGRMPPQMAQVVSVAPSQPAEEVLQQALDVLRAGGVVALPTDTLYGIACAFGNQEGMQRIQTMCGFDIALRPLTFLLPDLGELPRYATVNDTYFNVLRRIFPGPYCAELPAAPSVAKPFVRDGRRTIGVRIPGTALCEKLIWSLGKPLLSATAKSVTGDILTTAAEIKREYGKSLDLILDAGAQSGPPSTVVGMAGDRITVLREGRGPSNKVTG